MLNCLHPDIKFTMEMEENKLPFLDIRVTKTNLNLSIDIYYKERDTKQYTFHPSHTKRSILYNLARQICTVVSDPNLSNVRLQLKQSLLSRGYPIKVIENGITSAV